MTYEEWKEYYGLVYEPNYSLATEFDCRAAFIAGAESRDAEIAGLVEALEHSVLYVPDLATVPGIAAVLAKVRKP